MPEDKKLTKDDLIAQLYTLRAGLSAIAIETDRIKNTENELENLKQKNQQKNNELQTRFNNAIQAYNQKRETTRKELFHHREWIKQNEKKLSDLKNDYQNALKKTFLHFSKGSGAFVAFFKLLGFFLIIFLFCIYIVLPALSGIVGDLNTIMDWIFTTTLGQIILELTSLFCLIGIPLIVSLHIKYKYGKENRKKHIQTLTEQIWQYEQEISKSQNICQNCERTLRYLVNPSENPLITDVYINDINDLTLKLETEIVPISTTNAKSIKKALNQQFDSILSESDWTNIDLLIFYLYSGRADSLKEALLLVDQQRQTDQIVATVQYAAQYISSTIVECTKEITRTMRVCFQQLSMQIDENHQTLLYELKKINTNIKNTSDALEKTSGSLKEHLNSISSTTKLQQQTLMNIEKLNSALLSQANKSSDELMHELRYNQKYWA